MKSKSGWLLTAMVVLSTAAAKPAAAQLNWTFVGVGEIDTEDLALALVGVSVHPARLGWTPVGGVQVNWLQYPINENEMRETFTILPSVGIRRGYAGGSFQFRVGYAFRDANVEDDDDIVGFPPVGADFGDDGINNSAMLEYWGDGNGFEGQLIGSYNWGSEALWSRARATHRLFGLGGRGHIRAGGEVAYLTGDDYNAWQVGPVVGFHFGGGTIINAGIGQKFASGDGLDATYFRAELVLTPWRQPNRY